MVFFVSFEVFLELLECIDVVSLGVENGIVFEVMVGFWEGRLDYCEGVNFDDYFWEIFFVELIFMVCSFNNFCRIEGNGCYELFLEEKLFEVMRLVFYFEWYFNVLIDVFVYVVKVVEVGEEEEEDIVE